MIKVTLNVELKPFTVPNYVIVEPSRVGLKQEGISLENPKYHLNKLDRDTVSDLCDEFRRNVFLKAGIEDKEK